MKFTIFLFSRKNEKTPETLDFTGFSGGVFGVPEVIRTPDLPLRRRSLYPAELRKHIAIVWFLKKDSYNLRTAIIKIKATVSRKRETVFYVKIKYEAGKRCRFKPSSPSMRNQTG